MLKLIYKVTIALALICCWTAHAGPTNAPLTFYILSEEKIEGGRFIDTPAIPQAGFIGDKPDLTVTKLEAVHPDKSARIVTDANGNPTVVSNAPALAIELSPVDAKAFAALTEKAFGKRLLVMLGNKPLIAPVVRTPIETGRVSLDFANNFGGQAEARKVEDDLKKLVSKQGG
jgi:preprotein translocase subunit SecD